jgi:hypothetical protein
MSIQENHCKEFITRRKNALQRMEDIELNSSGQILERDLGDLNEPLKGQDKHICRLEKNQIERLTPNRRVMKTVPDPKKVGRHPI